MGRTESLNLKNDYERACGWYGHFNKSEMALFSECTDRYAQKLLDTADIVREAIFRQLGVTRVTGIPLSPHTAVRRIQFLLYITSMCKPGYHGVQLIAKAANGDAGRRPALFIR